MSSVLSSEELSRITLHGAGGRQREQTIFHDSADPRPNDCRCFYINLPVGAVTLVAITFLLKASPPLGADLNDRSVKSLLRQTLRLDWIGGVLILGAVTCLVLGLQWGGNTKPWDDAAVIVTLVLSVVIAIVLIFWQRYLGDRAMVPPAIFKSL